MIKRLIVYFWRFLFVSIEDVATKELANLSLKQELDWALARINALEEEVNSKTKELHMFVDAMLLDMGRAPLYLTPTALKDERDELRALIGGDKQEQRVPDRLKGTKSARQWSTVASSLAEQADKRVNGGV